MMWQYLNLCEYIVIKKKCFISDPNGIFAEKFSKYL